MSQRDFLTVALCVMGVVCTAAGVALIIEVLLHEAGC